MNQPEGPAPRHSSELESQIVLHRGYTHLARLEGGDRAAAGDTAVAMALEAWPLEPVDADQDSATDRSQP